MMINLFEYQNKVTFQDSFDDLEDFLDDIWNNREKSSFYLQNEIKFSDSQKFLEFVHKTNEIRSNKYVGVIHFAGKKINLLPKIFYDTEIDYTSNKINQIQNHILWWLSYCRKIKFPNYQTTLGSSKSDFFEVLIYLFSKYTRELLNSSIYLQYEEISREMQFIKGRLNINEYISENISKGRWHKLNCTYDAFVIDNEFNRIIKYVTNLLLNVTENYDNKKYLREIQFILDDVSDETATVEQCRRTMFNPLFTEFKTVRDYCELFLSHSISFDYKNDLKLFAFLLPMEYLFEDFIFGFIDKELGNVSAFAQKSDTYLDESKAFNLKPDLFIKIDDKSIIADTKYKIIYSNQQDPKKGISQNDLYQMLAYAVRFKVYEIILFYPNTITNYQENIAEFIIKDTLANDIEIVIKAVQLPIINYDLFYQEWNEASYLREQFESTKLGLINRLEEILLPNII